MDTSRSETELRAKLFELDTAMDKARQDHAKPGRLAELAEERDEVVAQLQDLLPEGADLGVQQNEERKFDKAAFVDTPVVIQGDGSEHG